MGITCSEFCWKAPSERACGINCRRRVCARTSVCVRAKGTGRRTFLPLFPKGSDSCLGGSQAWLHTDFTGGAVKAHGSRPRSRLSIRIWGRSLDTGVFKPQVILTCSQPGACLDPSSPTSAFHLRQAGQVAVVLPSGSSWQTASLLTVKYLGPCCRHFHPCSPAGPPLPPAGACSPR